MAWFHLPNRAVILLPSNPSFNQGNQHQECLASPSLCSICHLPTLYICEGHQLSRLHHCYLRFIGSKMRFFLYISSVASARVTSLIYFDALYRLRHSDYPGIIYLFLANFTLLRTLHGIPYSNVRLDSTSWSDLPGRTTDLTLT